MWTDNETDIDFLNFSGVAKTADGRQLEIPVNDN
jgi:hypothetical protein